jgi:hypothetical protein
MRGRVEVGVLLLGIACAVFTGWSVFGTPWGGAGAAAAPGPTGGPGWIRTQQGTVPSSAPPPVGASPTSPAPALTLAPLKTAGTASPSQGCTNPGPQTGGLAGLTVVPGRTSAVVSWPASGNAALLNYRLTAIPQRVVAGSQPPLRWQTIPAGQGCGTVTATVTGLTGGAAYIFSLDAVTSTYNGSGTSTVTIARSTVVYQK